MEKKFKILFALLIYLLVTASCQPTPNEQIVIQRDNFESLVLNTPDIIKENDDESSLETDLIHVTWTEEKQKLTNVPIAGDITLNITISVDSVVDLSKKTAPVYLVEPMEYKMDFIENAVDYFFKDEYYDAERTKDDYLQKILLFENTIPIIEERTRQPAEMYVKMWKEKYANAPKASKKTELVFDEGYYDIVCVKGYPYDGAISEFYVQNGGMENTLLYYYVDDVNKYYGETRYEYTGEPALGMTTSYEDAENLATETVNEIYGKDMMHVQTTLGNRGKLDENWCSVLAPELGEKEFGIRDQAYIFYFTRTYGNISQLYAPKASNSDNAQSEYGGYIYERSWDYEYSMKWLAEYVMVIVDDTGIVEFWGFSPTKTVDLINNNVKMLSFDEIFDKFKQNIYFNSAWADSMTEELKIHITDINFGMIRVPVKDNPDTYYMVPAWQFSGTKSVYTTKRPSYASYDETGKTFMVLNAIDGSIIDISYYENKRPETLLTMGEQMDANH